MKRFLIAAFCAPLLLGVGCNDDDSNPNKTFPTQIPSTERFPVVAWHGVRASFASVERFQQAERMGITLNYSRMGNVKTALKVLDIAAKTNIKLIVECDELYSDNDRRDAVRALMNHPALAGYFIMDEPNTTQFADMAVRMKEIQAMDKNHICYANIFPTGPQSHYDALHVRNYTEYVYRYLTECPATFLSFDKYPVVQDETGKQFVLGEWYEALEITSAEARKRNMELWTFMLTVPHTSYPQPTLEHLRLQTYSNLAYGTQALQCFTYWTPTVENPTLWNYRNGPIAEDGTQTPTYDIVKAMLDEVQQVAWIFRGCEVEGVWHLAPGGHVPDKTTALTQMPSGAESISVSDGEQALVSVLKNHGFTFMVFQNTDINNKVRSSIRMKDGARRVLHDGTVIKASEEDEVQLLDPGDVRIYMW